MRPRVLFIFSAYDARIRWRLGHLHRGFLLLCIPLTPERPPAGVSDMYSGLAASTPALDLRGCEASPDHVGQQVERKYMR